MKPGDLVEYSVEYKNQSDHALRSVVGTLPIPRGMVYVANSATPAGATATTNDREYAAVPLKRKQKSAKGAEVEVPVPLDEYRALRWNLGEIGPGASKTVSARVRVQSNSAPPTALPAH